MKKVVVSIVSAAALATASIAMAGGMTSMAASQPSAAGAFVSGNLGYGWSNYKKSDFGIAPTSIKKGGFAWNANVGYQFNQYLAVEGGYTSFADTKVTDSFGTGTISLAGFGADVKGILPINSQFNVFAKAGAIDMNEKGTINSTTKKLGSKWTPDLAIGTAYNVNSHVALTLQDLYTFRTSFTKAAVKYNIADTNSILAGISYKF